jgi:hypothetical protein
VIVPGDKTYSNIQSGLSRREASGIAIGREVENYLEEFGWGGMDWIDLAQNRDIWRALVNAVMYLGFHRQREFLD